MSSRVESALECCVDRPAVDARRGFFENGARQRRLVGRRLHEETRFGDWGRELLQYGAHARHFVLQRLDLLEALRRDTHRDYLWYELTNVVCWMLLISSTRQSTSVAHQLLLGLDLHAEHCLRGAQRFEALLDLLLCLHTPEHTTACTTPLTAV